MVEKQAVVKKDNGGILPVKFWWRSVRLKIIILILVMVIPLVLLGIAGTLYYQGVLTQNIYDNALTSAKTVAAMTPDYMQSSQLYMESIAERPSVVKAMEENDTALLYSAALYSDVTNRITGVYFTDSNGTIIVSSLPAIGTNGSSASAHYYVSDVLRTGVPEIGDAEPGYDNEPAVPIGVPVKNDNGTVIGVMVGNVDLDEYSQAVSGAVANYQQIVYIVNRTGHIMVHYNPEYVRTMKDFSTVSAVQHVLKNETGVMEYYNPFDNQSRLSAYTPISSLGWGVIVGIPVDVAYQPVRNATWMMIAIIILFTIIAAGLGWYLGNDLASPIISLSRATKKVDETNNYRKLLPLNRKDEIGELARSFVNMIDSIKREISAREDIMDELQKKQDELTEAKSQADLYLDLMGHDINNLNQVALGYLEVAEEMLSDKDLKELIARPLDAINSSTHLIDNVNKLKKLKAGGLNAEAIDLDKILREVQSQYSSVPDKDVTIEYRPCCTACKVMANGLVYDIFSNLVWNSIKHSEKPSVHITLGLERLKEGEKDYCKVTIEDDGPGIPDELKEKLFVRFQRGTTKASGKGLGLYLVKTLVEDFHGRVWVEDRVQGDPTHGSRFVVMLPAVDT